MNNQQRQDKVREHVNNIKGMDKQELHKFAQDWYLAKEDLDEQVFKWCQRAIDLKEADLQEIGKYSAEVIMSEMCEGDLK